MRKTDFPRLRAWDQCPLCGDAKARGALACWPCFNSRGIGAGDQDDYAEAQFAKAELALESAGTTLARAIRDTGTWRSQDARRHDWARKP
jgi:hypothetical protein